MSMRPSAAPGGRRQRSGGFSLLEMLVVLVIMGLLVALVLPRVTGNIGKGRLQTTRAQIEMLSSAVTQFYMDTNRYPTVEEGLGALLRRPENVAESKWKGPYLEKDFIPKDGWGHDFEYAMDEHGRFVIRSLGSDGRRGGEGDAADIDNRSA